MNKNKKFIATIFVRGNGVEVLFMEKTTLGKATTKFKEMMKKRNAVYGRLELKREDDIS